MLTLKFMWESRITPDPEVIFLKTWGNYIAQALARLKRKSLQTVLLQQIWFGCQNIRAKTFLPWGEHMTIWGPPSKIPPFIHCGTVILMCKCWYSEILLFHVVNSKTALPQLACLFPSLPTLLTAWKQLWRVPHCQLLRATSEKWNNRPKHVVTSVMFFFFFSFLTTYSIFLSPLRGSFTFYNILLSQVMTVCIEGWQNTHLLHSNDKKQHVAFLISL